jgi:hypothetical protein
MSAASGNSAGRIVEQIVFIEDKKIRRRKIVVKEPGTDVNGGGKVKPVVPEINQADPFGESERRVFEIVLQPDGRII